ncbi:hypothetical protein FB192DRAFT_1442308 [Mucor lusitanicus]|uniref:No apical meristem-associated C-terminal domain-containing protein n=2 Tax=Mucor circinelloides f. lusitanicus TaxID=29924 RepID=A0A168KLM2_MUCCL|nr:hypothetical protein FB192DRAFT_1442308 [Mucor lusitanicus]OAD02533.1 hypothetical protein MUCCIDRAFT_111924 [Mucor lusitanicus CBS 277.49]
MMEHSSVASSSSSIQTPPTEKMTKVWFDKLEDLLICESYCHVSLNFEERTKKTGKEFWMQVVFNYFIMQNIVHKQCTLVDRSWDSLNARCLNRIQKNICKFAGCLTKCIKKNASGIRFKECYDYLSEAFERWAAILNEDASGKAKLDDETADAIAKADHNSVRSIDNKKALTKKRKREVIVIDNGKKINVIEALIKEIKKVNDRAEERAAKIGKYLEEDVVEMPNVVVRRKTMLVWLDFGLDELLVLIEDG